MAQTGYDGPQPGDSAPKITGQRARQGQNIQGMLAVLVLGIVLVVVAYAIMLGLRVEPSSVTEESRIEAAAASTTQTPAGETPQPAPSKQ